MKMSGARRTSRRQKDSGVDLNGDVGESLESGIVNEKIGFYLNLFYSVVLVKFVK